MLNPRKGSVDNVLYEKEIDKSIRFIHVKENYLEKNSENQIVTKPDSSNKTKQEIELDEKLKIDLSAVGSNLALYSSLYDQRTQYTKARTAAKNKTKTIFIPIVAGMIVTVVPVQKAEPDYETVKRCDIQITEVDKKIESCLKQHDRAFYDAVSKVKNGANINATDDRGNTLTHFVAYFGRLELMQEIAKLKPNLNIKNVNGITPLHYAIVGDRLDLVKTLLENGANPNILFPKTNTSALELALLRAKQKGQSPNDMVASELIKRGADADILVIQNEVKWLRPIKRELTPLHFAIKYDMKNVVEALIENPKININTTDEKGRTPLMYALKFNHIDFAQKLIQKGARTYEIANNHKNAISYARKLKFSPAKNEIIEKLRNPEYSPIKN